MIRLALVGCGSHSETGHAVPLARYAAQHPGEIELAAACDLRLQRAELFCEKFGFARPYDDMDRMLDGEDIDGCICIVPVARIVQTGIELLRRKTFCVVEKPPGASLEEVRRLAEVARETGTPHMVSVNRRFIPRLNRAVSWARGTGPVRYVRGTMLRHNRREPGFIWSTAIHAVDAMRHLGGEVEKFEAEIQDAPDLSAKWYQMSFKFEGGCTGRLDILPTCGKLEETYELFGEGFRAEVSCGAVTGERARGMTLRCWKAGKLVVEDIAPPDEPIDIVSGFYGEIEEFLSALREGRLPRPSMEDVLPSAEICFQTAKEAGVLERPASAGKKRLKVDFDQLLWAMEDVSRDINDHYLDTETGELYALDMMLFHGLERGEAPGMIGEWQRDQIPVCRAVLAEDPRYVRVPQVFSDEAFEVMREFVDGVEDEKVRRKLLRALSGRRPFRRFKDAVSDHPDVQELWFAFEAERKHEWVREWLEEIGVDAEPEDHGAQAQR